MTESEATAALAATCQGWSYALNTVARPAAEHLEAAQAALNALERADQHGPRAWADTAEALRSALDAARARLQPREVTVTELVDAVVQLRALGLVPAGTPDQGIPDQPDTVGLEELERAKDRIATLEGQLEESEELAHDLGENQDRQAAEIVRLRGHRDRFESEARELRSRTAVTNAGIATREAQARATEARRVHLAVLALLGTSGPGFEQMPPEELAAAVGEAVRRVARESAAVPRMVEELTKTWRRLVDVQNGPATLRPEDPEALAVAVRTEAFRVCTTLGATRGAITDQLGEIAELRGALGRGETVDAVRAERDALIRSRDAQAETIRQLRAELAARPLPSDGT